jgi:hypothetical protein
MNCTRMDIFLQVFSLGMCIDTLPWILQLGGGSRKEILKKKYKQGSQVHKMFIHEEGKDPIPMTLTIVRIISVGWVEV